MKTAIIIPARYASTRLPGKPLTVIAGQTLLQRVVTVARTVANTHNDISVYVATDDARISAHAADLGVECLMTPDTCATGTDRVYHAATQLSERPDFIINLQGDAPFTPPDFLLAMIDAYRKHQCDMITTVAQLSWEALDDMRTAKQTTPFSGTTAVFDAQGKALWFSKQILPAIRKESDLRAANNLSPVYRHIGLYGYSHDMLAKLVSLPESTFEKLEGLEQLRALEHGYNIQCVKVDYNNRPQMSGIDSPEDVARAERLLG